MGILDNVVKNLKSQVETNVSNMFNGISQQRAEPQAVNGFFCPECGTRVEAGGRFCPSCGTAVSGAVPQQAASGDDDWDDEDDEAAQPPIPSNPAPTNESSSTIIKNHGPQLKNAASALSMATVDPELSGILKQQVTLLDRFIQSLKVEICGTSVTDQSVPVESSSTIIKNHGPQLKNASTALSKATIDPGLSGILEQQVTLLDRFIQSLKVEINE